MTRKKPKLSLNYIRHQYEHVIIPKFTKNIPKYILKQYEPKMNAKGKILTPKLVPIDTALTVLQAATVSGTSIQAATEHLGEIQSDLDHSMDDIMGDFDVNLDKLPNPNNVRRSLKIWRHEHIRSRFRDIIKDLMQEVKHSKLSKLIHFKEGNEGFSAAFDLTEVKYYGQKAEEHKFMNTSSKKGGSKYCYLYLTLQILCPGHNLILDAEPIYKGSKPIGKIMSQMLKRVKKAGIKLNKIYVGRGFHRAEVLQTFDEKLSRRLVMPAKRTNTIKKTIRAWYSKNGYTEGKKKILIKSGKIEQEYMLIFKPKPEENRKKLREKQNRDENDRNLDLIDQDFQFFCLLRPHLKRNSMAEVFDQVALEYSKRWGIETGYRVSKDVWAWTTSTSFSLRYWLMWSSIVVFNLWVLANLQIHDIEISEDIKGRRKSKDEIVTEIKEKYTCCGIPTIEEVETEKERRRIAKLPTEQRSTKEFPYRPWKPRPREPIRKVSHKILRLMLALAVKYHERDLELTQSADPPDIN